MNYRPAKTLTKVLTAGVAGAIVTVLVWVSKTYLHVEMPADVVTALTTILMVIVAYLTPLLPGEIEIVPDAIVSIPTPQPSRSATGVAAQQTDNTPPAPTLSQTMPAAAALDQPRATVQLEGLAIPDERGRL